MDIPGYPAFRQLELKDKTVFDPAFEASPPENSEYTFTNLYSWRNAHEFRVARLDGFIILAAERSGQDEYYPPIGAGAPSRIMKKILADTQSRFVRVPERVKSLFDSDPAIHASFDRNNSDYIFSAQDLIRLEGRRYDGKRNLIKNFRSKFQYEYVPVTDNTVQEILRFQDIWCVERGCGQSKSLQDESEAVKVMLAHLGRFGLKAGSLRVKGQICAVCIAESLNPRTLVIHVLKGAHGMTGIYQTMFNEFLTREGSGYGFVNMEQDLGIEGLRKSKESYHPLAMVRKYSLSLVSEKAKI